MSAKQFERFTDAPAVFRALAGLSPAGKFALLDSPPAVAVIGRPQALKMRDSLRAEQGWYQRVCASGAPIHHHWADGEVLPALKAVGKRHLNRILKRDDAPGRRLRAIPALSIACGEVSYGMAAPTHRLTPTPCVAYEDYWDTMDVWRAVWLCNAERELSRQPDRCTSVVHVRHLDESDLRRASSRFDPDSPRVRRSRRSRYEGVSDPETERQIADLEEQLVEGTAGARGKGVRVRLITDAEVAFSLGVNDLAAVYTLETAGGGRPRMFPPSIRRRIVGDRIERSYDASRVATWWLTHAKEYFAIVHGNPQNNETPQDTLNAVS